MNQMITYPSTLTGVTIAPNSPVELARKKELFSLLEKVGDALDLTDTQYANAKARYEAVGDWLARSDEEALEGAVIYPQGSVALGTANKPIGSDEHDVDLVAHAPRLLKASSPSMLKQMIGRRLAQNARYAATLEEKQRCWRITFAREFHMDITPSILNLDCAQGGEFVPDKKVSRWKPTNPRAYKTKFDRRAALKPLVRLTKAMSMDERVQAEVVAFPAQTARKGVLRRTVQILKRHRDVQFQDGEKHLAPLSVIITTLAAQSYEYCVTTFEFDNAYDLFRATISLMPAFIDVQVEGGTRVWHVWNETTVGEDFAEKWREEPARAAAFFQWHTQVLADIDRLLLVEGSDEVRKSLAAAVGEQPVSRTFADMTEQVGKARQSSSLRFGAGVGLTTSATAGTSVRANTFFGA